MSDRSEDRFIKRRSTNRQTDKQQQQRLLILQTQASKHTPDSVSSEEHGDAPGKCLWFRNRLSVKTSLPVQTQNYFSHYTKDSPETSLHHFVIFQVMLLG